MLLDAGSYVHDVLVYVKSEVELVQAVGVEGSVQDAQVVVVFDAGSVEVAEPQL
jgi:hypothetical protein